jgi:hypothetical protein
MDHFEKERRCRTTQITPTAIHKRLVATRLSTGFSAKDLAASAGIKYTTFKSQEVSGAPSMRMIDFYWKAFQVDANFILGGDFARILPDTLAEILKQLDDPAANNAGK